MKIEIKQLLHPVKESNRNGKKNLLIMEISHLVTGAMVIGANKFFRIQ